MSVDFIDSNVVLYLFDETDANKRTTAENLIMGALTSGSGIISFQVIQETMNVLSRKLAAPPAEISRFLEAVLVPLWHVPPSPALYFSAIDVHARYGFAFYDGLIVAAALQGGCTRLLTEDLHDGQQIGQLTITNPFRT